MLKLRFRENPLWNENLKPNVAWKFTLRDNPNFAEKLCVDFFKFRKYYAAHNSGLKIWLVSGIFEMAQLFNLKLWLYLWRLGVAFSPHFQAAERCVQHIFRTYAESFSPIFSKDFFLKLLPKNFAWYLKTEPNFVDKLCAEITFSGKSVVKLKPETKLCVIIRTLPINFALSFLSSENIMQHTTAV